MKDANVLFKALARYCAIIGVAMLVLYVLLNLFVTGGLYALTNSNSTFGIEQSLGMAGYVLAALCSPSVASLLLCFSLVFYLTARSFDTGNDETEEE